MSVVIRLPDGRNIRDDDPLEDLEANLEDAQAERDSWDADLAALEELITTRQRLALAEGGAE